MCCASIPGSSGSATGWKTICFCRQIHGQEIKHEMNANNFTWIPQNYVSQTIWIPLVKPHNKNKRDDQLSLFQSNIFSVTWVWTCALQSPNSKITDTIHRHWRSTYSLNHSNYVIHFCRRLESLLLHNITLSIQEAIWLKGRVPHFSCTFTIIQLFELLTYKFMQTVKLLRA